MGGAAGMRNEGGEGAVSKDVNMHRCNLLMCECSSTGCRALMAQPSARD